MGETDEDAPEVAKAAIAPAPANSPSAVARNMCLLVLPAFRIGPDRLRFRPSFIFDSAIIYC